MLTLLPCPRGTPGFAWAQLQVAAHHYLRAPVDPRSRPLAYVARLDSSPDPVGCLIFGRPEATRCYDGGLTYGGSADVAVGRAAYDRWEVLALCRVWLDPCVQAGGEWCRPGEVPGFTDRAGVWRPAVASSLIRLALRRVGFDYLCAFPPCFMAEPYAIRAVLSYCDTRLHRGAIYRASGFALARRNAEGMETWWTPAVAPLTQEQDAYVRGRSEADRRARALRARRQQLALFGAGGVA